MGESKDCSPLGQLVLTVKGQSVVIASSTQRQGSSVTSFIYMRLNKLVCEEIAYM